MENREAVDASESVGERLFGIVDNLVKGVEPNEHDSKRRSYLVSRLSGLLPINVMVPEIDVKTKDPAIDLYRHDVYVGRLEMDHGQLCVLTPQGVDPLGYEESYDLLNTIEQLKNEGSLEAEK